MTYPINPSAGAAFAAGVNREALLRVKQYGLIGAITITRADNFAAMFRDDQRRVSFEDAVLEALLVED